MQEIYVQLYYHGVSKFTNNYLWGYASPRMFSRKKWTKFPRLRINMCVSRWIVSIEDQWLVRPFNQAGTSLYQTTGNALKLNIEKSFFGQSEMKYLGFWVTREGVSVTCYITNLPRKPFNTPVSCPAHTRHSRYVTCVTRPLGMTLFWRTKIGAQR